jgi:hypothetical protein
MANLHSPRPHRAPRPQVPHRSAPSPGPPLPSPGPARLSSSLSMSQRFRARYEYDIWFCSRLAINCSGHLNGTRRGLVRNVRQECLGPPDSAQVTAGRTIMLTVGLILFATGMVVMSLESFGVAVVFFGIAVLLIKLA